MLRPHYSAPAPSLSPRCSFRQRQAGTMLQPINSSLALPLHNLLLYSRYSFGPRQGGTMLRPLNSAPAPSLSPRYSPETR
jgi:hypothetical protein